jgi:plasmid stabilization system protein ParE
MVKGQKYQLVITKSAEQAYFEVLDYVYEYHSPKRANEIAKALLELPKILLDFPKMGRIEPNLKKRALQYRYILFERTKQVTVKVIYYLDDETKTIYITDFFPSEMSTEKIKRNR